MTTQRKQAGAAPTPKEAPLGISVPAAGRQIGLGRAASYQAAKAGSLPTIKIGSRLIVPVSRFQKMLEG
jgi:hypothetical protein